MPLDPYSPCPGGRDKKIRFCCPDMLKELEQIQAMLENNQMAACISFIEQLEKSHPNCACLEAAKLPALRGLNRWEEAAKVAEAFHSREPENRQALAELAITKAYMGEMKEAVSFIIDAAELETEGQFHSSIMVAMYLIAMRFLQQGDVMMSTALAKQLKMFPAMRNEANSILMQSLSNSNVPLIIREMELETRCPGDFPEAEEYSKAVVEIARSHWKSGLKKLESLLPHVDKFPALWRSIAVMRFRLCDDEGALAALQMFSAMPGADPEDVAESEAVRFLFEEDAFGDRCDILRQVIAINEFDKAQEAFLSSKRFQVVDADLNRYGDAENPPPKNAFVLLDRPFLESADAYDLSNIPSQIATIFLYGKQTDRPARLEIVEMNSVDREAIDTLLKETAGDSIGAAEDPVVIGQTTGSQWMLQPRFRFKRDAIPSDEAIKGFYRDFYIKKFVEEWPQVKLGMLGGKTPAEAVLDPEAQNKLLGAICLIELWADPEYAGEMGNKLRERLQLPTLGPISLPVVDEETLKEHPLLPLEAVPVWRWYRLVPGELPILLLNHVLQILTMMNEQRAGNKFDIEFLSRPREEMTFRQRSVAYENLIREAQVKHEFNTALDWIRKAKVDAIAYKTSDGILDILEIGIRIQMVDSTGAERLIQEVMTEHGKEPEVMAALQNLFVRMGLLNPDGTPTELGRGANHPNDPAFDPGLISPQETQQAPASKLWLPD